MICCEVRQYPQRKRASSATWARRTRGIREALIPTEQTGVGRLHYSRVALAIPLPAPVSVLSPGRAPEALDPLSSPCQLIPHAVVSDADPLIAPAAQQTSLIALPATAPRH